MIEFTTGIAFLMSSIYGSGQADARVANLAAVAQSGQTKEVSVNETIRPLKGEKEIEAYIRDQYSDKPVLVEIAWCESRFHQFNPGGGIIRGIINKADVGIMQINEKYHADVAAKLGMDIYNVEGNVKFGRYLYDKYGVQPWSSSSKCWSEELAKK